jgi:hypothetical protein
MSCGIAEYAADTGTMLNVLESNRESSAKSADGERLCKMVMALVR